MRALDRVFAILEAVAGGREPVGPAVVAAASGLSLSTVSRLMRQMAESGMLERSSSGGFSVGARLVALAGAGTWNNSLIATAIPEMTALRDVTGETLSLHIQAGDRRVCVAEIQSRAAVRRVVPIGLTLPLHFGATGQVILAHMSAEPRRHYLESLSMDSAEIQRLHERLSAIRAAGYALAVDAWEVGVSGLAAPLVRNGTVIGSLSVSGPSTRWTEEVMTEHASAVVSAADRISAKVSGDFVAEVAVIPT